MFLLPKWVVDDVKKILAPPAPTLKEHINEVVKQNIKPNRKKDDNGKH